MKNPIQQLVEAFARRPGLDGVLHGARKIIQGKHGSRSALFYSRKNEALMPVESRLELAICYQLEWDRKVVAYRMQPLEVPWGGRNIYPDCCILDKDESFSILDVKPWAFRHTLRNQARSNYLRDYFSLSGIGYSVAGEELLGNRAEQVNRVMIYNRGGRIPTLPQQVDAWIRPLFGGRQSLKIQELRQRIKMTGSPIFGVEAAIFCGLLQCNMRYPITDYTIVQVTA